ncbi:MAG: exodeoxyribonuclease VII large subunit [Oscillospiraceae bacterium]
MKAVSVSSLNRYVKGVLDKDPVVQDLCVAGEISDFTRARGSGHIYFTLSDRYASVRAVMFNSYASTLKFDPADGDSVTVRCSATLYEKRGAFQLYVYSMAKEGEGDQLARLEKLIQKLKDEGLFAVERKRPLPQFPKTIGVVTSPDAAAFQDILNVVSRRYPFVNIKLFPASVQGVLAEGELVHAIERASRDKNLDVVIIARGGGSSEDLSAFNSEKVARAAAALPVPFISAVGHETDTTIIDYIADMRAPTPSAAAELAVPDEKKLMRDMASRVERMTAGLQKSVNDRERMAVLTFSDIDTRMTALMRERTSRIREFRNSADLRVDSRLSKAQFSLREAAAGIDAVSPVAALSRGYVIAEKDGRRIRSAGSVEIGDRLDLLMRDGTVGVEAVSRDERKVI